MADEIRTTEVERDSDGRIQSVDYEVERKPRKRGGGFGWGMLFGLIIAVAGIAWFAYSQGSFQTAGAQADRAAVQAEQQINETADNVGARIDAATDDSDASAQ